MVSTLDMDGDGTISKYVTCRGEGIRTWLTLTSGRSSRSL